MTSAGRVASDQASSVGRVISDPASSAGRVASDQASSVGRVLSDPASRRRGGSWLLEDTSVSDVFTPEKRSEEHRLMAQTTDEFIGNEVLPNLDKLETKDWQLARSLIRRCGELGLLGTTVPEEYGGLDLDKVSSLIVAEHIARSASFATTYGGQANLCILPIVLFGTDAQKKKYLPPLVAGEMVGAYALSES